MTMKTMEAIWTVRDIAERYKCTLQCARNYVRRMPHMENPLTVYESDLLEWEHSRMQIPPGAAAKRKNREMIVPRTR